MKKMFVKSISLSILILGVLLCGRSPASCVEQELELYKGLPPKKVKLFGLYKTLSKTEKQQTRYVPQGSYTCLEEKPEDQLNPPEGLIIGPLHPCLLVALKNTKTGKSVVFHKHFTNSPQEIVTICQENLNYEDPRDLQGLIFTTTRDHFFDSKEETTLGLKTPKELHQGRTHKDEVLYNKNFLLRGFKIQDRKQIRAFLFTPPKKNEFLGEYFYADTHVYLESDLNPRPICPMHEKYFGNFGHEDLVSRVQKTSDFEDGFVARVFAKLLQKVKVQSDRDLYDLLGTYGKVPFIPINF